MPENAALADPNVSPQLPILLMVSVFGEIKRSKHLMIKGVNIRIESQTKITVAIRKPGEVNLNRSEDGADSAIAIGFHMLSATDKQL